MILVDIQPFTMIRIIFKKNLIRVCLYLWMLFIPRAYKSMIFTELIGRKQNQVFILAANTGFILNI